MARHRATGTFDVFDTVLTRAVGEPTAVFRLTGRLLAERGAVALTPEVFAVVREQAERRAHAHHGPATTLDHILSELAFAVGLDDGQVASIRDAELEVERAVARPVPGATTSLAEARARWGRVVFISDTYLSSAFVRELLEAHGLWAEGDRLYVSCDAGSEKRSGRLFGVVARAEGTRPWRLVHHGNDATTDIRKPQRRGVRIAPMTEANLNRFERVLEAHGGGSGGLTSALAGASRLARLDGEPGDEHRGALREVAAGVVAPLLTGFVLWLLADARRRGLGRLYFVSRDGEVLLDIARRLAPRVGYEGELRYLHGSRQAWSVASTTTFDDFTEAWLVRDTDFLSVRSALARAEVEPAEVAADLATAGFGPETWDDNLTRAGRRRLAAAARTTGIAGRIEQRAAERRPVVTAYLRQEGVLDGVPAGIVDLGWVGRIGAALVRLAEAEGAPTPACFYYFGLSHEPPKELQAPRAAYLFDRGAGHGFRSTVPGRAEMLEAFCAGSHGVVLGYRCVDGRVEPVLNGDRNQGALDWGLLEVRHTVGAFADALLVDPSLVDLDGDARPALVEVLRAFAAAPTRREAEAWGAFPFSTDQTDAYARQLAAPYRLGEALWATATGAEHRRRRRYWAGGSTALSNVVVRRLMGRPMGLTTRVRSKAVRLAGLGGRR